MVANDIFYWIFLLMLMPDENELLVSVVSRNCFELGGEGEVVLVAAIYIKKLVRYQVLMLRLGNGF